MPIYRWKTPHDWLYVMIRAKSRNALLDMVWTMAEVLDDDQIIDLFEGEMKQDGYWQALPVAPIAEERICNGKD